MKTAIIGYPRIGRNRELKFLTEKYFENNVTVDALKSGAKELRRVHWDCIARKGIDFIPSNDFSFYDNMLDTACLFNIIPQRYKDLKLSDLDTYFAMARGYQAKNRDAKALPMKKWLNTNYHYIVPEFEDSAEVKLFGEKPFTEYKEAIELNIKTKPVIIGPFTLLKLSNFSGSKNVGDFVVSVIEAYGELLKRFSALNAEWVQFDEPSLVTDLTSKDKALFLNLYSGLLKSKWGIKILLQTYFGDIRDIYSEVTGFDFDGIGLDFVEGCKTFELIEKYGFPAGKLLFAGVVHGKNIWRNYYRKTLSILEQLTEYIAKDNIVISPSCSLLHVPYTADNETEMPNEYKEHLAFAEEKLAELSELNALFESENHKNHPAYLNNCDLFTRRKNFEDLDVKDRISALKSEDFTRLPGFYEREAIQKQVIKLSVLPTTTIGSFPQTDDVKANRAKFKRGEITEEQYIENVKAKIEHCVRLQEGIGLDVLVHGEYERNDMVEFFGENLSGFLFTSKAWVQSYGTRCVKPPIFWSDIKRSKSMTTDYIKYAQSLTDKPVKGMLTGPITILNWSFPRDDISHKEMAFQLALAIRDEVLELEASGIRIIQVDEAALKEKLPIRREDWHTEYLDWAIPAFRLVHSGVRAETQIHTHMCYSEFNEIIREIDEMDADVISFEASRSQLGIVGVLKDNGFKTQVGPGVYDIHSPRIPSEDEIKNAINKILEYIRPEKLWINPDCGLKTRGEAETIPSLKNLVTAARLIRANWRIIMNIDTLFAQGKTVLSFEIFPPKRDKALGDIYETLNILKSFNPDFISVTFGAGGTSANTSTCDIANIIKNEFYIEPLVHLTCINSSKDEISAALSDLKAHGLKNILALRGDRNPNATGKNDFAHASDLISFIRKPWDFHISAACYPEGHIEAKSVVDDIMFLKKKVDLGASHLISQLFFDNSYFYAFLERASIAGISVPIEAGIMPVVNKNQIEWMVSLCGATLPEKFQRMVHKYEHHPDALRDAGIAYAVDQIVDLMSHNVDGIHLYTMNNPHIARKISEGIASLIRV